MADEYDDPDEGSERTLNDVVNRLIDHLNRLHAKGLDPTGVAEGGRWAAAWFSYYAVSVFYQLPVSDAEIEALVDDFRDALRLAREDKPVADVRKEWDSAGPGGNA